MAKFKEFMRSWFTLTFIAFPSAMQLFQSIHITFRYPDRTLPLTILLNSSLFPVRMLPRSLSVKIRGCILHPSFVSWFSKLTSFLKLAIMARSMRLRIKINSGGWNFRAKVSFPVGAFFLKDNGKSSDFHTGHLTQRPPGLSPQGNLRFQVYKVNWNSLPSEDLLPCRTAFS